MFGFNDIELKQTRFYQQAFGEGRVEGRVEGEALLLLNQLECRFGRLPGMVRERIAAADGETLLVWGKRLLDAKVLDEVWKN